MAKIVLVVVLVPVHQLFPTRPSTSERLADDHGLLGDGRDGRWSEQAIRLVRLPVEQDKRHQEGALTCLLEGNILLFL